MIDLCRGRDLGRDELRELVADLAARPQKWRHLVHHDPEVRTYEQLLRDEHVAVWLICWMDDHDTGFHDHDVSCGALAVAQGAIVEERLALGGGGPAITLNAYSPPLWRMGAYETTSTGELQRHSISYAEELRPLELATGA